MRLQLQTWQDIDTYLTRSRGIMIPIGSTEQHGPNGLIGTDALCPEVIAWRAAEQCGAVVGPTISVGMAHTTGLFRIDHTAAQHPYRDDPRLCGVAGTSRF